MGVSRTVTGLCLVALAISAIALAFVIGIKPSDDQTYLYSLGSRFTAVQAYETRVDQAEARLEAEGFSGEILQRLAFRTEYAGNYFAHGLVLAAAKAVLPAPSPQTHAQWTVVVNQAAVALVQALAVAALILLTLRCPPDLRPPVIGLLGLTAVGALLPHVDYRLIETLSAMELVKLPIKTALFLINPGAEFDIIGQTPRSAATMFIVCAFVARWLERPAISYALLGAAALCHATYGGIGLCLFLGLDLALTPERLLRWTVALPAVATLIWFVTQGLHFGAFHAWLPVALALVVAAGIALAATPPVQILLARIPWVRRLRDAPPRLGELICLALAAALILTLSLALAFLTEGETRKYIAAELSGRPLGILRGPLFLGAAAVVFPWILSRIGRWTTPAILAATALACGLVMLKAVIAFTPPAPAERLLAGAAITPATLGPLFGAKELAVYYSIVRDLDGIPPEGVSR